MQFSIITLFPEMFAALDASIIGRARENNRITLRHYNPRDYSSLPNRAVDDRPYGGGPGMVMCYQPLADAIQAAKADLGPQAATTPVIYLAPQGHQLDHSRVQGLATLNSVILLCGRYEGIDQRLLDTWVDETLSIGDYVVSGGELPAMVLIDAVSRWLPGVLGHADGAREDSFSQGLLEYPHYTRPAVIQDQSVPPVLLSGNHNAIATWRRQQALQRTWQMRPDLLKRHVSTSGSDCDPE